MGGRYLELHYRMRRFSAGLRFLCGFLNVNNERDSKLGCWHIFLKGRIRSAT